MKPHTWYLGLGVPSGRSDEMSSMHETRLQSSICRQPSSFGTKAQLHTGTRSLTHVNRSVETRFVKQKKSTSTFPKTGCLRKSMCVVHLKGQYTFSNADVILKKLYGRNIYVLLKNYSKLITDSLKIFKNTSFVLVLSFLLYCSL